MDTKRNKEFLMASEGHDARQKVCLWYSIRLFVNDTPELT